MMKIMLTYVGGIAGQSVIKMIRRSKYNDIMIIGLDSDKNAVGLKWCDLSEVVPSADYFYDLGYQSEYRKIIEREKPDLILPTGEEDLEFLDGRWKLDIEDNLPLPGIKVRRVNYEITWMEGEREYRYSSDLYVKAE